MNPALWVFRKELRESLKDRRVVVGAFVMPVFFVLLFAQLMGSLEKSISKESRSLITVVGEPGNPIIQAMASQGRAEVTVSQDLEAAKASLRKGRTSLVYVPPMPVPGRQMEGLAVFDGARPLSLAALGAMRQAVTEANSQALSQTLREQGIDPARATPLKLKTEDIAEAQGIGGTSWASLLPYMIVLWAFYGGMSMVADLVAGEKERKSLETLLLAPVPRRSIVGGKFLALAAICMMSGLTSLVGLALSAMLGGGGQLSVTPLMVGVFLAVLTPLVALYAGMLLAVSSLAKSIRECQTYLALLSFVVMLPAVMSQFVGLTGADQAAWTGWTPILNTSMALTQALKGQADPYLIVQSVLTSGILGLAAAAWAVRLFDREEILQRT